MSIRIYNIICNNVNVNVVHSINDLFLLCLSLTYSSSLDTQILPSMGNRDKNCYNKENLLQRFDICSTMYKCINFHTKLNFQKYSVVKTEYKCV